MADDLFASSSFEVEAAATAPIVGPATPKSWLDAVHPRYHDRLRQWETVADFYHGRLAESDRIAERYLIKRTQGESDAAYRERLQTVDFTPHLGTLIDTLAGMLFAVEDRASRVWTTKDNAGALGDPTDRASTAARLLIDCDGQGTGWTTKWRQAAIDLIVYQVIWVLVDRVADLPVVRLIPPTDIPNWINGPTGPIDVLMKESADLRSTLEDTGEPESRFIRWQLDGWTRWAKDKEGQPYQVEGPEGSGIYTYVDRLGQPALPIFPVRLPIRRYVSYLLAKKAAAVYNLESVRDFTIRPASFSKFIPAVAGKSELEKIEQRLKAGSNVIPENVLSGKGGHRYVAPDIGPVTVASEVLKEKRDDLWVAGFKMYGDSARERTATEIKQDVASGVGAFLQLLKVAVDDAENGAFWRLEQIERANDPTRWGVARVERADDFSSIDFAAVLDQQRTRYLAQGAPIPLGRSALIELAKQSAQYDGLPADPAEVATAVDTRIVQDLAQTLDTLGVTPAIIKARLAMKLIAATGLVDPQEEVDLADGSKANLLGILQSQAEDLARSQEEAARRLSELPPFGQVPVGQTPPDQPPP